MNDERCGCERSLTMVIDILRSALSARKVKKLLFSLAFLATILSERSERNENNARSECGTCFDDTGRVCEY